MSSNTLSDSQRAIIAHCAQHEILHPRKTEFVCVVFEGRFIKYGNTPNRITAYLVMEYIELKPSPAQDAPQRVAKALQWLRDLPTLPDVTIGPLGGGHARHPLFKDFEAPLSFSSIDALERYMNKARNYIHPRARPDPVSFSGEQLVFTQSNMDERNFPDDMEGNTCLLGFEDVGLLPESFASYTVSLIWNKPFVKEVAEYLQWPAPRSSHSMARIGSILQMIGDETLGLNEDGRPTGPRLPRS